MSGVTTPGHVAWSARRTNLGEGEGGGGRGALLESYFISIPQAICLRMGVAQESVLPAPKEHIPT